MTAIIRLSDAITSLNSNAKFRYLHDANDKKIDLIDTIEWLYGTTPISNADILAEQKRLQTQYDSLAYARKRAIEYPSVQDFMEAYTEKEIGGDDTKWNEYKTKYNKVRTDNPKE